MSLLNDSVSIFLYASLLLEPMLNRNGNDFTTLIITSGSALVGAFLGSFFTYKYGTKIENEKQKREKQRQKELDERIKALVRYELGVYQTFLRDLNNNSIQVIIGTNPDKDDRRIKDISPVLTMLNISSTVLRFPSWNKNKDIPCRGLEQNRGCL
jgi:hypothetical protein